MKTLTLDFDELLDRYPGGLAALTAASGVSDSTLRRLRLVEHQRLPWKPLRAVALADGWDVFDELAQVDDYPDVGPDRARRKVVARRLEQLADSWAALRATRVEAARRFERELAQ